MTTPLWAIKGLNKIFGLSSKVRSKVKKGSDKYLHHQKQVKIGELEKEVLLKTLQLV